MSLGCAGTRSCAPSAREASPIVDDLIPLVDVSDLGVDETASLRATGTHPILFATGITDLSQDRPARLLEVCRGRSGMVLSAWRTDRDHEWKQQITIASLDPFSVYATVLGHPPARYARVLDPFHIVELGSSCVDNVRCRAQRHPSKRARNLTGQVSANTVGGHGLPGAL